MFDSGMSIGEGIFYSSIIVSSLALYITTKDRWNWAKIIKRITIFTIIIATVIGLSISIVRYIELSPRKLDEYLGIALSDTQNDIRFKKGKADAEEDDAWFYEEYGSSKYLVLFEKETVWRIINTGTYAPISGVKKGSTVSELENRFGSPSRIINSDDGLRRWYIYDQYNTFFVLEKNKVDALGIYNPDVDK